MTRRGMYGAVSRVFPNEFQIAIRLPHPDSFRERALYHQRPLQRLLLPEQSTSSTSRPTALAERVKAAGSDEARSSEGLRNRLPA